MKSKLSQFSKGIVLATAIAFPTSPANSATESSNIVLSDKTSSPQSETESQIEDTKNSILDTIMDQFPTHLIAFLLGMHVSRKLSEILLDDDQYK